MLGDENFRLSGYSTPELEHLALIFLGDKTRSGQFSVVQRLEDNIVWLTNDIFIVVTLFSFVGDGFFEDCLVIFEEMYVTDVKLLPVFLNHSSVIYLRLILTIIIFNLSLRCKIFSIIVIE